MSPDVHHDKVYHQKVKRIEYIEEPLVERLFASGLTVIEVGEEYRH